jgi:transketolase
LSRQGLATVRTDHTDENLSAKGAYLLANSDGESKVTILATGSEVEIAMEARAILQSDGVPTAVVSMPSWNIFEQQDQAYRNFVLGSGVRVAVEAAVGMGWDKYIGPEGVFIGMSSFGASAPASDLYKHFDITAEAIIKAVKDRL